MGAPVQSDIADGAMRTICDGFDMATHSRPSSIAKLERQNIKLGFKCDRGVRIQTIGSLRIMAVEEFLSALDGIHSKIFSQIWEGGLLPSTAWTVSQIMTAIMNRQIVGGPQRSNRAEIDAT
jgi:hypothetical protein